MADISFLRDIGCPPERCRELLLDPVLLKRFVDQQHPLDQEITVDEAKRTSTLTWSVSTQGLPGPFAKLAGQTASIRMVIVTQRTPTDNAVG